MLDIKFIRENLKEAEKVIQKRRLDVPLKHLIKIDEERLKLIREVEDLRHQRKVVADKHDEEKGKEIKEKLSKLEGSLSAVGQELIEYLEQVPNMLSPKVPEGTSEKDNKEIKTWGKETKFDFKPKDHLTIGKELMIIDQERSAKTSGHGFYYLTGDGARLQLALTFWVVDTLSKKGFTPVITPELVRKRFVEGTGYLPRREEPDIYKIEGEDLYLTATSEIPIAGLHADEIMEEKDLPKKYVGFSSSFRKEAGSYGKYTHGIFRVHQFDKVEIFRFVKEEESDRAFDEIISLQEQIYQALEIPYRIVNICSGEMSAAAYLKYDLEYWDPVTSRYRELTSASNTTDYQARRLNIKYRGKGGPKYVHTLNGTAIALSRTMIAILENHQQKDGSVKIPKVLHEYLGKNIIQRS
ncbi:MAG: serine--tRNA ligase [Candidatus Woykebacteria bacterium RBG_16_43_9]|uniref:Serine--tRNA ligase n=1 Tax=Candidatus Woykebacteria bacterium RBG_16_43_9 TaxID=1802596 RepID=A0A1G1WBF4_9BACT|nr:MAG: serine--tRNA ligase [Candidatus Woykebacteria bacterium RBG_16_43_9]